MTKLAKNTAVEICEKLVPAPEFRNLKATDISKWANNNKTLDNLLSFRDSLPQGKLISTADVCAWLYSLEERVGKNVDLRNLKARMTKISPYEAGIILREFEEGTPPWYRGRSAEDIRRFMLMRDLYSDYYAKHDRPQRKLVSAFYSQMDQACHNRAQELVSNDYGPCKLLYVPGNRLENHARIAATGMRYAFLKQEGAQDGQSIFCPCIFVVNGKEDDEFAYAPEVGAMALLVEKENIPAAFVCALNPETYDISVSVIPKEQVLIFREKVGKAVDTFWQENVLGDTPFTSTPKSSDRLKMDTEGQARYMKMANAIGRLYVAKKKIEEEQERLRVELDAFMREYARENGAYVEDVQPPSAIISMVRAKKVNLEEAQRILDAMPTAANTIISKLEPNMEMMVRYMKEHGVDERFWKQAKINPDMLIEFCNENGMEAPVSTVVSFRINSTSQKSKELIGQTEVEIAPALELLGIESGVPEETPEDDASIAPSF